MHEKFNIPKEELESDFNYEMAPVISVDELYAMCEGDEILEELFETVLNSCKQYTETVIAFQRELQDSKIVATEEYQRISEGRGRVHDRAISDIDILARTLNKFGRDGSFVGQFNGERAHYARFAILLTLSRLV